MSFSPIVYPDDDIENKLITPRPRSITKSKSKSTPTPRLRLLPPQSSMKKNISSSTVRDIENQHCPRQQKNVHMNEERNLLHIFSPSDKPSNILQAGDVDSNTFKPITPMKRVDMMSTLHQGVPAKNKPIQWPNSIGSFAPGRMSPGIMSNRITSPATWLEYSNTISPDNELSDQLRDLDDSKYIPGGGRGMRQRATRKRTRTRTRKRKRTRTRKRTRDTCKRTTHNSRVKKRRRTQKKE